MEHGKNPQEGKTGCYLVGIFSAYDNRKCLAPDGLVPLHVAGIIHQHKLGDNQHHGNALVKNKPVYGTCQASVYPQRN